MMIDHDANKRASNAIDEARKISDLHDEKGGDRITVPVIDTTEFWAGISLLTVGEYKLIPQTNPRVVVLEKVKR